MAGSRSRSRSPTRRRRRHRSSRGYSDGESRRSSRDGRKKGKRRRHRRRHRRSRSPEGSPKRRRSRTRSRTPPARTSTADGDGPGDHRRRTATTDEDGPPGDRERRRDDRRSGDGSGDGHATNAYGADGRPRGNGGSDQYGLRAMASTRLPGDDEKREAKRRERGNAASEAMDRAGIGQMKWGVGAGGEDDEEEDKGPKERVDFKPSGALAAETNTTKTGVVLKFNEPPNAKKPTDRWRLMCFKGEELVETYYLHRKSVYLIGRNRLVADVPTDHLSCSGQHAVIQFRDKTITVDTLSGPRKKKVVVPYLMDLESTHGTFLGGKKQDSARYIELLTQDILKFGQSTRDYVLINESAVE